MSTRLLEIGEQWLRTQMLEVDGVTVRYYRGVDFIDNVPATKGARKSRYDEESGAVIVSQSIDFLIDRSNLVLNSSEISPEPNDRIVVTENGKSEEYRVCEMDGDCFYYSDRNQEVYRIHTSYVGRVV